MFILKIFFLTMIVGLAAPIYMTNVYAEKAQVAYTLDSKNSLVSFSTIKKRYVVEKAAFTRIKGGILTSGEVLIHIDATSIDTGDIRRDEKLNLDLFSQLPFAKLKIHANISLSDINVVRNFRQKREPITIKYADTERKEEADFLLSKTQDQHLVIASMSPIIVNINDYGVPLYVLESFSRAISKESISSEMPFNFVLVFKKTQEE